MWMRKESRAKKKLCKMMRDGKKFFPFFTLYVLLQQERRANQRMERKKWTTTNFQRQNDIHKIFAGFFSFFFVPSASYSLPRRIWKLESLRFMMKQYLKYTLKRARINRRNVCIATELEWKNSQSICSADHTRVCTYYLYQRANAEWS